MEQVEIYSILNILYHGCLGCWKLSGQNDLTVMLDLYSTMDF
jgi:hypothetical protein